MKLPQKLCLFAFAVAIAANAQSTSMFQKKYYEHAEISISVVDLATREQVVHFQTSPVAMPASVMKLVTTGAAFELLGAGFDFKTKLYATGNIENGVLNGDLVVVGGGDPTLGSRYYSGPTYFMEIWVRVLKAYDIKRIKGRILVQSDVYDTEGVSPFWLWEDIGNYYATGVYGLNVFDNSFELTLKSKEAGSKPEIVSIVPNVPGLTIQNNLIAANNSQDSAYLYGAPFQNEMRLFGTMPANQNQFVIRGQIPNPSAVLVAQFAEMIRKSGIVLNETDLSLKSKANPEEWLLLRTDSSIPLMFIVDRIHKKSDNFFTECVLRAIAANKGIKPASAREGIRLVKEFWQQSGLDVSALSMYDACGLSPNNRLSAKFLTDLLITMSRSRSFFDFERSLPLAGEEGTVANFLRNTPLQGKVRLKSGSNQVVNSYAGYYRSGSKKYVVAILVNHASASRATIRKDMEDFLLSL